MSSEASPPDALFRAHQLLYRWGCAALAREADEGDQLADRAPSTAGEGSRESLTPIIADCVALAYQDGEAGTPSPDAQHVMAIPDAVTAICTAAAPMSRESSAQDPLGECSHVAIDGQKRGGAADIAPAAVCPRGGLAAAPRTAKLRTGGA